MLLRPPVPTTKFGSRNSDSHAASTTGRGFRGRNSARSCHHNCPRSGRFEMYGTTGRRPTGAPWRNPQYFREIGACRERRR